MADKIKLLSEVVANQIAAGEVVNRPSSVVKEMMENAIDAKATSIKVNFREGGKDLIHIVDDGCGMSPIDARLAFDRHATSKIRSVDDIYALHTFGFRGEALASIVAVAQVELRTRQESDEVGTLTEVNGGEFVDQRAVMCGVGSQFFVRNLFYNVPARRRFLEKTTTSASHIKAEFQRVALCYPQINFELFSNDAPLYNLQARSLAGRIVDVIGKHIKHNLLEVTADTSIAKIGGYIGRPAAAKKRNFEQFLFVNGRYFSSPYINKAIIRAYEKLIPESCYPSYFLYLTIDPERIDVNVHPQKTEVKFEDEEAVWQIVNAAVRETLAKTGVVPLMDFDNQTNLDIPVITKGVSYGMPKAVSDSSYNPFVRDGFKMPTFGGGDLNDDISFDTVESAVENIDLAYSSVIGDVMEVESPSSGEFFVSPKNNRSSYMGSIEPNYDFEDSQLDFVAASESEPEQLELVESAESLSFTNPVSLGGGYVMAMMNGRPVFLDVKRAKERILYEYHMVMLSNGSAVNQQLLFPEKLVLSSDEYSLMESNAMDFAALGFDIEYLGDGEIEVKGTPADMPMDGIDELLYELLQAFDMPITVEELRRDKIALVMAQSGSRGINKVFVLQEMEQLLEQLSECDNPSFSPSGKAVLTEITMGDIRAKLG